jgi:hypothetical protein
MKATRLAASTRTRLLALALPCAVLGGLLLSAGSGRADSTPTQEPRILVITQLDRLASRTGIGRQDLESRLKEIGDVLDITSDQAKDWSYVRIAERAKVRATPDTKYTAVQIVGGDGVVPMAEYPNPQYLGQTARGLDKFDPLTLTDRPYADLDADGVMDVPVARLLDAKSSTLLTTQLANAKKRATGASGFVYTTDASWGLASGKAVEDALGSSTRSFTSPPKLSKSIDKNNAVPFDSGSGFAFILQHGSCTDRTNWQNNSSRKALDMGDVVQADYVMSGACWGGWAAEREYTYYVPQNGWDVLFGPVDNGVIRATTPTPSDTLALAFLSHGARGFFGSTGESYASDDGDRSVGLMAKAFFASLKAGSSGAQAAFDARVEVAKFKDAVSQKMALEYNYYGVVPYESWLAARQQGGGSGGVSTSLVFDVSGTMGNDFNGSQKLGQAQAAGHDITAIIKNTSQSEGLTGEMAVASFDTQSYRNQDITTDYDAVNTAIDSLRVGDSTNLSAGIESGLDQLEAATPGTTKVMLLLSDGQANQGVTDPDAIIAGPVQRAKDANVKINVIGFGEPNDLNEDLLRRIASETGGEYTLANTSAIANSIASLFIKYQMQANHTVLGEYSGTVSQGAVAQAGQFSVQKAGNVTTVLNWPGSELDLRLTDPKGADVASGYPGFSVAPGRPLQVFIEHAQPGTWTVSVYGRQVSMDSEPYYALVAYKEATATASTGAGGGSAGNGAEVWLLLAGLVGLSGVGWVLLQNRKAPSREASSVGAKFALAGSHGVRYTLKDGPNSVGRDRSNDVVIADRSVSRRHALVVAKGPTLSIRDLGSSLGTSINGTRTADGTASIGDEIRFGEARVVVEAGAPDLAEAMRGGGRGTTE